MRWQASSDRGVNPLATGIVAPKMLRLPGIPLVRPRPPGIFRFLLKFRPNATPPMTQSGIAQNPA